MEAGSAELRAATPCGLWGILPAHTCNSHSNRMQLMNHSYAFLYGREHSHALMPCRGDKEFVRPAPLFENQALAEVRGRAGLSD